MLPESSAIADEGQESLSRSGTIDPISTTTHSRILASTPVHRVWLYPGVCKLAKGEEERKVWASTEVGDTCMKLTKGEGGPGKLPTTHVREGS